MRYILTDFSGDSQLEAALMLDLRSSQSLTGKYSRNIVAQITDTVQRTRVGSQATLSGARFLQRMRSN